MAFHHPICFALLLLPLAGAVLLFLRQPSDGMVPSLRLFSRTKRRVSRWRSWVLVAAMVCLVLAMTGPSLNMGIVGEARPVALAVDLSGSMEAYDMPSGTQEGPAPHELPPSRMERARAAAAALLTDAREIALVAFAGRAWLASPLTRQTAILKERLSALETMTFEDGTAIGLALQCALRSLPNDSSIFLFTDGADHGNPDELKNAIAEAKRRNIRIHALAVGSDNAFHATPDPSGHILLRPVGETVRLDSLKQLTAETGGLCTQDLAELQNWHSQHALRLVPRPLPLTHAFVFLSILLILLAFL
ncbi:MAG: VWA domain-containing protein [Victivallales bacterium]|nr:VWA domain-containing protein [Victivallales bacterium]